MLQAMLSLMVLGGKVFLLCAGFGALIDLASGGLSMGGGFGIGMIVGAAVGGTIALAGVALFVGGVGIGIYNCFKNSDGPAQEDRRRRHTNRPKQEHRSSHAYVQERSAARNDRHLDSREKSGDGREKEYHSSQAAASEDHVQFSVKSENAGRKRSSSPVQEKSSRGFWDKFTSFWRREPEPAYQGTFAPAMDHGNTRRK